MSKPDSPAYLETLASVRDRALEVLNIVQAKPTSFSLDLTKLPAVADYVTSLIQRDYVTVQHVKPHSRWRHYEMDQKDRIQLLIDLWIADGVDPDEQTRRVLDLIVVSVLLDAGAGNEWKFKESGSDGTYSRSEGLALAALEMFTNGYFSTSDQNRFQVDGTSNLLHSVESTAQIYSLTKHYLAHGLKNLTVDQLKKGFQVSTANPLVGLEGRCNLLISLGRLLESVEYFHGKPYSRPGNMLDYLTAQKNTENVININEIWTIVQALKPIWPSRMTLDGITLGDVWHCACLPKGSQLVPLHKLSQWLTYSILEPIERMAKLTIMDKTQLTGLAEYRNGGLFIDMGVLQLTSSAKQRALMSQGSESVPLYTPDDQVIVEWRALTVALLDKVANLVRTNLNMNENQLELAKVLEGGTWKAGRELASKLRPITKGPPMNLISDGTVF